VHNLFSNHVVNATASHGPGTASRHDAPERVYARFDVTFKPEITSNINGMHLFIM